MKYEFNLHMNGVDIIVHDCSANPNISGTFSEESIEIIKAINSIIRRDHKKEWDALCKIYDGSAHASYLKARRHIKCNLSLSDSKMDLTDQGFTLEDVVCPMRGECKYESIICHPEFNTELSTREMEVALMLAKLEPIETIADQLFISIFTVENHRKSIYKKLEIHSQSELVTYFQKHNLL